jgi:hypothetical protein
VAGGATAAWHGAVGFPEWLAQATGFALVPGERSIIALGLADALLAVRLASRGGRNAAIATALGLAAWAALLGLAAWRLETLVPTWPVHAALPWIGLNATIALVASLRAPRWSAAALVAAAAAWNGLWFNPLVRGGGEWLSHNRLLETVRSIDRAHGDHTLWVVWGDHRIPNLVRAGGVRVLNGVHSIPQHLLWAVLDPGNRAVESWNRYAQIAFEPDRSRRPWISLEGGQLVGVHVHPRAAVLRRLGVTHFLVRTKDPLPFAELSGAEYVDSMRDLYIFEAPRRRGARRQSAPSTPLVRP